MLSKREGHVRELERLGTGRLIRSLGRASTFNRGGNVAEKRGTSSSGAH